MLESYPRYVAYRDSGVEWLGGVPSSWLLVPGLRFILESKEKNTGMKRNTVLSLSYGNIRIKQEDELTGLVPESFETYQIVSKGDLIFRPTDLQNDNVSLRSAISNYDGIITSAYLSLKFKNIASPKFFHYFFRAIDNNKLIYGLGSGLRQNISYQDFRRFLFPFPSLPEQIAIANFLDKKITQIDTAITQKQRLIKLLKERKQIMIQEAVTKGLQPDVAMKDSVIECIGGIPEHWEIRKLRFLAEIKISNVDKHIKPLQNDVLLCNYVDVYKNNFITSDLDFMKSSASKDEIKKFKINISDVIITKDSEDWKDIGNPALVKYEEKNLICGYHLAIVKPQNNILGSFLFNSIKSPFAQYQLSLQAKGITRYGLSIEAIKNIWLPLPPIPEQTQIVNHIQTQSNKIDHAIDLQQQQIAKLQEYKTILIDNAVTGKIKVS